MLWLSHKSFSNHKDMHRYQCRKADCGRFALCGCVLCKRIIISAVFPLIDLFLFKSHASSLTFTENPKSLCQAALMNRLPPLKLVQNCWTVTSDSELDDLYRKHYLWLQWHITAKVRQISESIHSHVLKNLKQFCGLCNLVAA